MAKQNALSIPTVAVVLVLVPASPVAAAKPAQPQDDAVVTTPDNFQVEVGASSVTVEWDRSTSAAGEVVSYFVQLGGRWLWTAKPTLTLYLERSSTYALTVQAQDEAFNRSDWSDPIEITTPDQFPVSTPANVGATASPGSLTVEWDPSTSDAGVMDYVVELRGGPVGLISRRTTSVSATFDLPSGGAFEITVRARDTAYRWSDASDPLGITVPPADDWEAPTAPTNLRATFATQGPTLVEWDASSGGSGRVTYDLIVVEYNNTPIETTTETFIELFDFGECQPGDPQPLTFVVTASSQGVESPPSEPITMCFG